MCYYFHRIHQNPPPAVNLSLAEINPTIFKQIQDKHPNGAIRIFEQQTLIAEACLTPYNYWHISFPETTTDLTQINQLILISGATTVGIQNPTSDLWDKLKSQGYFLRSEFVRWFAPTPSLKDPTEFLDKQRTKHLKYNLRKAKKHAYYHITPLTAEIFAEWLPIYLQENTNTPGRFIPFTIDKLQSGQWKDGFYIVMAKDHQTNDILGGGIINSWGFLNQIGKNKLFPAFTLRAFKASERQYALGYIFFEGLVDFANQNNNPIICHGADFNYWGSEVHPGLFGYKTGLGMYPFPEGKIEAFKVVDTNFIKQFTPQFGQYLLAVKAASPLEQTYFKKREAGWNGIINELYQLPTNNIQDYLDMMNNWLMHHFHDKPNQLPIPRNLDLIEQTQPAAAS